MTHQSFWPTAGLMVMLCATVWGCNAGSTIEVAPEDGAALEADTTTPDPTDAATSELADIPAFATPQEAVKEWLAVYRQEGEDGHRRMTFDQNNLPEETWRKALVETYDQPAKAGDVQILDVLQRDQTAAVIVRLGEHVDRFALYRDAEGWRLCRTLRNWDAVKMPPKYGGVMKEALNLNADATVSEIEWRNKLASNQSP